VTAASMSAGSDVLRHCEVNESNGRRIQLSS